MYLFWGLMLMVVGALVFLGGLYSLISTSIILYEYILWEVGEVEIKIYLLLDWMSLMFSVLFFISSMVVLYSVGYMEGDLTKVYFLYEVWMFVGSMVMMIISPNLLMILLGWDGLNLVSYCLVIYYQNMSSDNAGMATLLSNWVGDIVILLATVMLFNYGTLDFWFSKKWCD